MKSDYDKRIPILERKVAVIKEKIKSAYRSLKLQATEYKRRLRELNHEARRIESMKDTFVNKDTHIKEHEKLELEIKNVQKSIKELQRFVWVVTGGLAVVQIIIYILFRK